VPSPSTEITGAEVLGEVRQRKPMPPVLVTVAEPVGPDAGGGGGVGLEPGVEVETVM
jgi:hypothetical protein